MVPHPAPAVSPPLTSKGKSLNEQLLASWNHIVRLRQNGIIVQAIGIPLRHIFALYGLFLCCRGHVGWRTGLLAFLLWPVSGLGVTAGAHRLWTHQSFKATSLLETLLMLMFSIADQGPIEGWALTHAMHHRASDTRWDPHNRESGFWHAHFGWLFSTQKFKLASSEYHRVIRGLGPSVRFHDRHFIWWDPLWSLGIPTLVAFFWDEPVNGFFVAGALRWAAVQHITFFVNSVAHGPREAGELRSFDSTASGIGPRVSVLTTVLALGEGWHDYHHLFPWDYAAAELNALDQWNPTKVFIDVCTNMGLATRRRRGTTRLQELRRSQLTDKADGGPVKTRTYKVVGPPLMRYKVPVESSVKSL